MGDNKNGFKRLFQNRLFLIAVVLWICSLAFFVIAFQATSSNYSLRIKWGLGGTGDTNATSSSYEQRFISGEQPVSEYSSSSYSGRLGILEDKSSSRINFVSPSNLEEILRGGREANDEDSLFVVSDFITLESETVVDSTGAGIPNINVSFYFNESFIGSNLTNSSGIAILSYDKSSKIIGEYVFSVNYTTEDYEILQDSSEVNVSIYSFTAPNSVTNYSNRLGWSVFEHGGIAKFTFNITKINVTGVFAYDPQNISVSAMGDGGEVYPESAYVDGYRLNKINEGYYQSWVEVDKTLSENLRWELNYSDDNFLTYLGSASHSDVAIYLCGDGTLDDPYEQCDDGKQCTDGTDCTFDESACVGIGDESCEPRSGDGCSSTCLNEVCGNDYTDMDEVCDGTDLNGETCVSQGFTGGTLACADGCLAYDTSSCTNDPVVDSCFPAGTKILMADGLTEKDIEDVVLYEEVLSYDVENDKMVKSRVLELESPVREGYYNIKLTENSEINVTDEHPFYVKKLVDGKDQVVWAAIDTKKAEKDLIGSELEGIKVYQLKEGDHLFTNTRKWVEIKDITYFEGNIKTYNLKTVDDYNKFFANGFLVHNKDGGCENDCTEEKEERVCLDEQVLQITECGYIDSDSCLDLRVSEESCGEGFECLEGICIEVEICESDWECGDWGECTGGEETRTCEDVNGCDPEEKEETRRCVGETFIDENGNVCYPDWECGDWGECKASYSIEEVMKGEILTEGEQSRECHDNKIDCAENVTQYRSCALAIPIDTKITEWCNEKYVEVYNRETNDLISRLKQSQIEGFTEIKRLDISFVVGDFGGYCDYCYNGLKDYDETGIDCGGPSCPECVSIYEYFDWLSWLIILIWATELLLLYVLYRKEISKRIEVSPRQETGLWEWIKSKFRFTKTREKESSIENKINRFFAGLFKRDKGKSKQKGEYEGRTIAPPVKVPSGEEKECKQKVVYVPILTPLAKARKRRKARRAKKKKEKEAKKRRKERDHLAYLKRKLREWRKKGYHGTAKLEKEIKKYERKFKK